MRPRVFPAEDAEMSRISGTAIGASMRPRVFPAEDSTFVSYQTKADTLQ